MIVGLEVGKRRVFAAALEWPGWCRSGRGEEAALATLATYAERYEPVARGAGLAFAPDVDDLTVVERVEGNATTDFGAPGAHYGWDGEEPGSGELADAAALLSAAYRYFDTVVAGAPQSLRKGPRGGGRDRDAIVAHVMAADVAYGRKLGLARFDGDEAGAEEISAWRTALVEVFARAEDGSPRFEKGWPLRYAARRGIWHVLDHAWEIQDRSE